MANYYCKWCGVKHSSVTGLTGNACSKNPNGKIHELYEGSEKVKYTCKYCGVQRSNITSLIASSCIKSPTKVHQPAL